jgi:cytochrome c553
MLDTKTPMSFHANCLGEIPMKKITTAIIFGTLMSAGCLAQAADAAAGKEKAQACVVCHGAEGISTNELWPNLAGQKAGYLAKQMKAFRDGSRTDPMMSPMAKPLTDADIDNLADYSSSLKKTPTPSLPLRKGEGEGGGGRTDRAICTLRLLLI